MKIRSTSLHETQVIRHIRMRGGLFKTGVNPTSYACQTRANIMACCSKGATLVHTLSLGLLSRFHLLYKRGTQEHFPSCSPYDQGHENAKGDKYYNKHQHKKCEGKIALFMNLTFQSFCGEGQYIYLKNKKTKTLLSK